MELDDCSMCGRQVIVGNEAPGGSGQCEQYLAEIRVNIVGLTQSVKVQFKGFILLLAPEGGTM
jgi:hypothetical protein